MHFNCTVEGVSATNTLTWWHHHPTKGYTKIFQSHSSGSNGVVSSHHGAAIGSNNMNSRNKYKIKGFYNLYINNIAMQDSGEYICEISGHRNYSASLTYVGKLIHWIHISSNCISVMYKYHLHREKLNLFVTYHANQMDRPF